jgi:hypothetical protein
MGVFGPKDRRVVPRPVVRNLNAPTAVNVPKVCTPVDCPADELPAVKEDKDTRRIRTEEDKDRQRRMSRGG